MSASSTSSGGGGGTSGATSTTTSGPCGACKFLRRKCVTGCIFAPYFDSDQGASHFAAVHKVFGASNVSKLLLHIPVHKRLDAVVTICYEAQARIRDPVYGCVAHIFALQQQVANLQAEMSYLQAHLATLELPSPAPPAPPQHLLLSMTDLPSSIAATFDLSTLFDPLVQPPNPWAFQQRHMDLQQFGGGGRNPLAENISSAEGGGDLQALARELLQRQRSAGTTEPSPLSQPPSSPQP
ncbi:hypothetical protein GIB67_010652 [Kingdonia uniflora]|uniref:LOB domain-containing protein n=1 Tax=Kingdonia uniflora TaxID=39325 RepID=A0A7J7MN96_9MAGN|nr:hypothetical protein GIB67_010652 [Kingdonia uniflora]